MTRRQRRFARTALAGVLRSAVAIGVLLVISGTHMARRTNTDTNDTDSASPSRNRNTDAPNTRAQRAKDLDTLTGRARPKIGAPTPPKGRYPRKNTRRTDDGETIVADRDRDLPVDWTKGFTENLDAPKQNDDGSWTINLRMHDGWNQEHFDAKAQHLDGLAANDKLELKTGDGEERGGAVDSWRSAKEREIFYSSENQAEYDARIADLDNTQIDHAHELQLGGEDNHDNMWAIDSATNHGMGGQINSQLTSVTNQLKAMGYSDAEITGTLIRINVVPGTYTP
ncbi:hypothetical protein O1R50_26075 [Glycomyces luteolus]|uniref:Uncharacterized protein n=1 Tax=Glycomyces luteolus TaxID=2670330 RepID=A0A9X3PDA7_9ACTN|nr:hypothetical protein [Glycomyces luteolus]MDA1363108.1 hypothetical protein [Glycomyces luteolus]